MDAVTVEVLTRWGQVRSRHRLTTFPATLGRGHGCDVVLDDADVSNVHARVEQAEDGAFRLVDAGSTNGLRAQGKKVGALPIDRRVEVRLASAHLRLVPSSAAPEKTALFRVSRLDGPLAAGLAWAAWLVSLLVSEGLLATSRVEPGELASQLIGLAVIIPGVWAFGWALASRVGQGHLRFAGHFAAACLAMLAAHVLVDGLVVGLDFMANASARTSKWVEGLAAFPVVAWALFQHLSRVTLWSQRGAVRAAVTATASLMGLVALSVAGNSSKHREELPLSGRALPPAFVLGKGEPAASVAADVEAMAEELAREVGK